MGNSFLLRKHTMLFLFVAVIFFGMACKKESDETNDTNPPNDTLSMSFKLMDLNGNTIDLSAYKGKVVTLFFFGYSCPYCIEAAPQVESELLTPYAGREDYVVFGIDAWDGTQSNVETFRTRTGVTFPLLLKGSEVAKEFGTTYDRVLVLDKTTKVVFRGMQKTPDDLVAAKQAVGLQLMK